MIILTPEFKAALEEAVLAALEKSGIASAPREPNPEHVWLTTKETLSFLRLSMSAFTRFKRAHPDLRVSTLLGGTEPRYNLASLQKLMSDKAVGGPADEAAQAAAPAPAAKPAPEPKRAFKRVPNITLFPRRNHAGADVRTPQPQPTTGTLF